MGHHDLSENVNQYFFVRRGAAGGLRLAASPRLFWVGPAGVDPSCSKFGLRRTSALYTKTYLKNATFVFGPAALNKSILASNRLILYSVCLK